MKNMKQKLYIFIGTLSIYNTLFSMEERASKNLIDVLYDLTKKLQNLAYYFPVPSLIAKQESYIKPEQYIDFPLQYKTPYFLEKSIQYFVFYGFTNKLYSAIIHDAFKNSSLDTAKQIVRLALQTKLLIEKQRALAIVNAYNQLQE